MLGEENECAGRFGGVVASRGLHELSVLGLREFSVGMRSCVLRLGVDLQVMSLWCFGLALCRGLETLDCPV